MSLLGMVGLWPLDETSGLKAIDLTGYNNSGTLMNSPLPVVAKVLKGLQFDGGNDYVEVPDQAELNFGIGDFSFDAWIQTTMASGAGDLVDKRMNTSGIFGYSFFINDGYLSLELANGTLTNYVSPVFVADGKFHHIAVTVSRANPRGILFYIDGVPTQFGDPTTHTGSLDVKGPLRLGGQSFSADYLFKGILDEVELFNRVITKAEINSIFNAGSSGKCKLGSICGTKFNDLNGNGRRDDGESGIGEWQIMLDGTARLTTMTDKDGNYCFTNLLPGDYKIVEELRPDWQQKAPAEGYYGVNLNAGQNISGKDFGNILNSQLSSICGMKYNDLNGNGKRDEGEPGIKGWTILIGGTADFSVQTDENGEFCFTNLKPSVYKIGELSRQGWIQTAPSSRYFAIDLSSGKNISGLQFGNKQRLVIVSPFDGAKILEGLRPTFEWLAPVPIPPGKNNYEIKIVEILGNQSPEEAIQSFASFFDLFTEIAIQESGELFYQYPESAPKFEVGKKYAWVVKLDYLMSEVRIFTIQGANEPDQVSVKLTQPPPNQLNAKDLWNAVLLNTTDANLNLTLFGTLELTGQGIVAEGKSILMNLPPGTKGITYNDIKIGYGYSIFDRWGNLIFLDGEFTMCIQVKDEYGVEIGSGCIVQNVKLPTSVSDAKLQQPYNLEQNYPNPFNSTTTIGYYIPQPSFVNISVFDIYGKEIKVLVNEEKDPGHHEIVFDRQDFVSGIYFYTLKTAGFTQSKKMILMK